MKRFLSSLRSVVNAMTACFCDGVDVRCVLQSVDMEAEDEEKKYSPPYRCLKPTKLST